ncbi:MAG: PilZ domain-containing protein [Pseudomonadota bacterium]
MQQEKRKYRRLPIQSRVFIELRSPAPGGNDPGQIALCHAINISQRGLRVELATQLHKGSILQIGIDLPDSRETLYLAGEVRWCEPAPEVGRDYWSAGFLLIDAEGSDLELWRGLLDDMEN